MKYVASFWQITLKPYILIFFSYTQSVIYKGSLTWFFWKTTNYADAYWFLYSNKRVTYIKRTL